MAPHGSHGFPTESAILQFPSETISQEPHIPQTGRPSPPWKQENLMDASISDRDSIKEATPSVFTTSGPPDADQGFIDSFPQRACCGLGSFFSLPLRFKDDVIEETYHDLLNEQVQRSLRWLFRFTLFAVVVIFAAARLASDAELLDTPAHVFYAAVNWVAPPLLLLLIRLLCARAPRACKDAVLLVSFALIQALFIAASASRVAFAFDVPPDEVLSLDYGYSDSGVAGWSGLFNIVVFCLLPVRCRSVLPMLLWVPMCYLALTLPLPDHLVEQTPTKRFLVAIWLFLQALVALAAKTRSEFAERDAFVRQRLHVQELRREKMLRERTDNGQATRSSPFSFEGLRKRGSDDSLGSGEAMSSGCPSSAAFNLGFTWNPELGEVELAQNKIQTLVQIARNEHWLIEPGELEILDHCELGRGGFGKVVVGRLYGLPVAVKMSKSLGMLRGLKSLVNELRIFRRLRHPNIVMFHGAHIDVKSGDVWIVEEVVPGATLANLITPPPSPVKTKVRCVILLRVCKALRFLHLKHAIMHGDLKPGNILVPQSLQPKLTDFGLARILKNRMEGTPSPGGTRRWSAPESGNYGEAEAGDVTISSDIWSLGRLCYFTVTGEQPLEDFGQAATPFDHLDVPLQEECHAICKKCGKMDPADRPTISEVHAEIWEWLPRKPQEVDRAPSMAEWLLDDTLLPPDAVPPAPLPSDDSMKMLLSL